MTSLRVSIVIPAYNEARRLPTTLERIFDVAESDPTIFEVIIVDDGSRDETAGIVSRFRRRKLPVHLVSYRANGGKGYAVRRGVMQAAGDAILISDADLSTPITELSKLLTAYESSDVVIGSRALALSDVQVRQAWYRQKMGRTFNSIMAAITGLPFRDTQCGFKLLRKEAARRVFEQATVDRFAWDVEMLMLSCAMGYRVQEVPVVWINSADSRVRILRDSSRMLFDTLRMRIRIGKVRCTPSSDRQQNQT